MRHEATDKWDEFTERDGDDPDFQNVFKTGHTKNGSLEQRGRGGSLGFRLL